MSFHESVTDGLTAALAGPGRSRDAADRFCRACVELLGVDGAALSIIYDGAISRSLGASSETSNELDELQFTLGEGPCLESVRAVAPVLVDDLETSSVGWTSFADEALRLGVHAVFALPVSVAGVPIGALDLYRNTAGSLDERALHGGLVAARLAVAPLLDIMGIDLEDAANDATSLAWDELSTLTRIEVYQAAGMLIVQLGVSSAEALLRLRAHAYANDLHASQVAFDIIEGRLQLEADLPSPRGRP